MTRGQKDEAIRAKAEKAWRDVLEAREQGGVIPSQRELAEKHGVKQQYLSYYFKKFREDEEDSGWGEEETSIEKVASEGVNRVLTENIKSEAMNRTAQYLDVGKTVSKAFYEWGSSAGIPANKLAEMDVAQVVTSALEYYGRAQQLEAENRKLKGEIEFLRNYVDPVKRLHLAMETIGRFAEVAVYALAIGIDLSQTDIPEYYQKLLTKFLKGGS